MLVQDRMTANPITVSPETTHKQAAEVLREHDIHHLPVVDNHGKLVGIVVEEDLLAAQPSPATTLSIYEIHGLLSRLKLKDIMTHPVHTTTPDCPLEEAARLMFSNDMVWCGVVVLVLLHSVLHLTCLVLCCLVLSCLGLACLVLSLACLVFGFWLLREQDGWMWDGCGMDVIGDGIRWDRIVLYAMV